MMPNEIREGRFYETTSGTIRRVLKIQHNVVTYEEKSITDRNGHSMQTNREGLEHFASRVSLEVVGANSQNIGWS